MDCLFCKISNHEIPSKILYEDDTVLAFLDIHPNVNGHTLIIPKKHIEEFTELDKDTLFHINEVAKALTEKIMKAQNNTGMTLSMNYKDAQEIKHVHLHLLPDLRKKRKILPIEETFEKITNYSQK